MGIVATSHRFTVDDYHRMAEAAVFAADDRVELLDGEIVDMAPIGSRHASRVKRLTHLFVSALETRVIVSVQDPIQLGVDSEPRPDLALLRPRPDFYAGAHPGPQDILLVIEVADVTVELDRDRKVPLYARAGIPQVLLVNLPAEMIECYSDPSAAGYSRVRQLRPGDAVPIEAFPELRLTVDDVLR